jgi:hypothetical protein
VTVKQVAKVKAAIAAIGEDAWTSIKYPKAVWEADQQRWISDAQIAEVPHTAFASTRQQVTARLIVRRVRRLDPKAVAGQTELFALWRFHAVFTDNPHPLIQAESEHRGHAIIEQTIADLISGPLAHLPSGRIGANGAWLALAAIAHNLTRAAGCLAGGDLVKAGGHTIRTRLINVAARVVRHARMITLRLPQHWPWQAAWRTLHANTILIPAPGYQGRHRLRPGSPTRAKFLTRQLISSGVGRRESTRRHNHNINQQDHIGEAGTQLPTASVDRG